MMEALMQYVWQHRLLTCQDLVTTDGRRVVVLDPGLLNTGPGPDFSNAKVRIGDQVWAGAVEMHIRASDWHRHGHDGDLAYDGVVLHVVDNDDVAIQRSNGEVIPQMVMKCEPDFSVSYNELVSRADSELPCATEISQMPQLYREDWLTSLAFERIYAKAERVIKIVEESGGDWEAACYITMARGMGFGTNADPFQRLAACTPLMFLRKHADAPMAVEAILLGQSGLLSDAPVDDTYALELKSEYYFYRHKFGLTAPGYLGWKASRPQNSPQRRVALMAMMVSEGVVNLSRLLEVAHFNQANELLSVSPQGFWANHYAIGSKSSTPLSGLSKGSVALLVINVLVPLMMARGHAVGDDDMVEKSLELLHSLQPERNHITMLFASAGLQPRDAFDSQALIELRRAYCEPHKCLYCRFGHQLLSRRARRS